jgi:hypothetical protein
VSFTDGEIMESMAEEIQSRPRIPHLQFVGKSGKFEAFFVVRRSGGRQRFCGEDRTPTEFVRDMRRACNSAEVIRAEMQRRFPSVSLLTIFREVNQP